MAREDSEVRVLQDPLTYMRAIHKEAGARWVLGLKPVEDEMEARDKHSEGTFTGNTFFPEVAGRWSKGWLRVPILLGVACLVHIVYVIATGNKRNSLDFPSTEEELWNYGRWQKDGTVGFLKRVWCLWLTSSLTASFSLALSWKFGTAARHFLALCGVGISLLSFMAMIAQFIMLWAACGESPISKVEECSVPFVLYWTFSVIRLGGPPLAVWGVGPVLDIIWDLRAWWKILLGLPFLLFTVSVSLWVLDEHVLLGGDDVYQWCGYMTLASWGPLLVLCCRQRRFQLVFVKKTHKE
ncbi:hypothetical protein MOQ_000602 [Trypanosoma cruzi marinkellei]|uniref:Uncharacterized protein n=1 Tax=Trypanosoma cruzi marinkellei TaxID=85056 RepID=K2PE17_TRYCR|nr:hypothetical protein MOQ_000602 [Trypanosoma cruzi marinkellei]